MTDTPDLRTSWSIPDDVTYLNHGSFGPTPKAVFEVREEWSRRLAAQPMDFYLRQMEPALDAAAADLAKFIDADPRHLAFVDNATAAMNAVAATVPLAPGDEILLNDHEYGAVQRIWRSIAARTGAKVVTAQIPVPVASASDVVDPLFAAVTPQTKLIVVSHVSSPTAIVFPVSEISRRAKDQGIAVCVDGPHAIAMRDVSLRTLNCDFYCASLHKWLSAPFGSGFLYVAPKWQGRLKTPVTSWGRSLGGRPARWQDELNWLGTRDPAACLAVPAAIRFLEAYGLARFRDATHALCREARCLLETVTGCRALVPDSPAWYGSMITIPLPAGGPRRAQPNAVDPLQQALWDGHRIEVPVFDWHDARYLRVSCHLYNAFDDLQRLADALRELLPALRSSSERGASVS
jgi:isopenicillin-N epimerase